MGRQIEGPQINEIMANIMALSHRLERIYKFVNKQQFKVYYDSLSPEEQEKLIEEIYKGNENYIKTNYTQWYYKHFGSATVRYLRETASSIGIPYYSDLTKEQLIKEIYNATNSSKTT